MTEFVTVDLLILDDFALSALDPVETADVYELVVERHRRASTVVTSNRAPAEWQSAELAAPATAHVLLGYGFTPGGEPQLVYTAKTSFETEPAKELA